MREERFTIIGHPVQETPFSGLYFINLVINCRNEIILAKDIVHP
jgi:hypothetical protein